MGIGVSFSKFLRPGSRSTPVDAWRLSATVSQAIRLASTDARNLVPRLLHLVMVEPKGAEMLGRTVAQKAADLPGWIWLPWIPQLMTSLQRPEVAVARRILSAAATSFPQQLYWHVRPCMLALKEVAVKAAQEAKAQVRNVCVCVCGPLGVRAANQRHTVPGM